MWKNQENTHFKKVFQKNRDKLIFKKFSKINTKKSGKYWFLKSFPQGLLAYGWCTAGLVPIPRVTKECLRRSSSRQSRNVMGIERAPSALSRNHVLARAWTYIRNTRAGPSFKTHCVGAWLGATAWGQLIWCSTSRITAGSDEDIVLGVV